MRIGDGGRLIFLHSLPIGLQVVFVLNALQHGLPEQVRDADSVDFVASAESASLKLREMFTIRRSFSRNALRLALCLFVCRKSTHICG